MELGITVEKHGDWTVVAVSGEVDVATAPSFRQSATEVLDSGVTKLIIDMTPIDFIDSSGLGVLIGVRKRVEDINGELVLVAPQRQVNRLFDITGLTDVFTIVPTLDMVPA